MASVASLKNGPPAYIRRLGLLAPLVPEEIQALGNAAVGAQHIRARLEIVSEGELVKQPRLLLSGWAARVRDFTDGRRQILHVLLPGDLIDVWQQRDPHAASAVVALTDVTVAAAPCPLGPESGLARAYGMCAEVEQRCSFRQIARLGRLDAYERLVDLFLELSDRLTLAGIADGASFPLPMTQEMLADCLGLTSVHINRTLQVMRREGVLELRGTMVRLIEIARLRAIVDFQPIPHTAD